MGTWGNYNVKTLNRTKLFQKRAIRTINNAKFNSHNDPLFKATSIMEITGQYIFQSILFVFNFVIKTIFPTRLSKCSDATMIILTYEQLDNQV